MTINLDKGGFAHISNTCKASAGKRKVSHLSNDTHDCKISMTFVQKQKEIQSNIWIEDGKHTIGIVFEDSLLDEIYKVMKSRKSLTT